jgi:uncharacterized protein with PIN domain
MSNKFIADVHLGKLARWLRLLGFDTAYKNDYTNEQLIQISKEEERVLLSRNTSLSANKQIECFVIAGENPSGQLISVVEYFDLKDKFRLFSRCLVCNGILEPVSKESILNSLQKNTAPYFNEFWQCKRCKRIYWKGSHYERMLKKIESIPCIKTFNFSLASNKYFLCQQMK